VIACASAARYSAAVSVDSPEQLEGLKRAGRLVAETLRQVQEAVAPGVTTRELDDLAADLFAQHGARSGPVITYDYPGAICISVDDQIVHGVPGGRVLNEGQLVTLDVAAELDGYHADVATTVAVGHAAHGARRIVAAARACLRRGIATAQPGATLRDVGAAVERVARARGFRVVPELTGHGIGRAMHESPTVHNWGDPTATQRLTPGMVFTIEPMIVAGRPSIYTERDGWTIRTADRSLSAHEEHTIMVSPGGPVIITAPA
jgi:methionyl aminopeptidase